MAAAAAPASNTGATKVTTGWARKISREVKARR